MSDVLERMLKCQYPQLASCGDGVTVADAIAEITSLRAENEKLNKRLHEIREVWAHCNSESAGAFEAMFRMEVGGE